MLLQTAHPATGRALSPSSWYQPFFCRNRVPGSCSQGEGCALQQFRTGIYRKQAINTSPLLPRPKAKAAPPRSMGAEFCCFNSAAAWHDGRWRVGWEVACMDAGKALGGLWLCSGVTRVAVLVLPYETVTHAPPSLLQNQTNLGCQIQHLFRPGLAHSEQLPATLCWITFPL